MNAKHCFFSILFFLLFTNAIAQSAIQGAWSGEATYSDEIALRATAIFSEAHYSIAYFSASGDFIGTEGGSYALKGDELTTIKEFDVSNPKSIGQVITTQIKRDETTLTLMDSGFTFEQIDDGTPGALAGAWLFYSRNIEGSEFTREANADRKTMKILSGTRFQWIAYDTKEKKFMATGGGTYETIDNEYSEIIDFFSKDASRIGKSLEFDYELVNDEWKHTGLSSVGDPIDETWKRRKTAN